MTDLVERLRKAAQSRETISLDAYGAEKALRLLEQRDALIAEAADALSRAGAAEGWTCSECGQGAPERFRVFARCHICAANQSVRRLKATIDGLRHASPPAIQSAPSFIDIVCDGPPGPEAGRFVEVENDKGRSIKVGEWVHRPDGYWALRIQSASPSLPASALTALTGVRDYLRRLNADLLKHNCDLHIDEKISPDDVATTLDSVIAEIGGGT